MNSVQRERREHLKSSSVARYERMVEIRHCEDRILQLFADGQVRGSTHTAQGQEAIAIAIAETAELSDWVTCTYRGHAVALALGMSPVALIGEILGREIGCTQGIGGSMHLCDRNLGLFPTFAIVGAGLPVAVGAALSSSIRDTDEVAYAVFGDGAANIGAFHEAMNLASIWKLPVVFICENNLYGEYSRIDRTTPIDDLADRGAGYRIPSDVVDGQDVDLASAAISEATDRARTGGGPTFLEMKTYRYAGHSRTDQGTYRPPGELDEWLRRDPIEILADRLIASEAMTAEAREAIDKRVKASVEDAIEEALASAEPPLSAALHHVFADNHD